MTQTPPSPQERRDYFRVNDRVALRAQKANDKRHHKPLAAEFLALGAMLDELHLIDEEQQMIWRSIAEKSHDLSIYLKAQQRKIELLARHLVLQQVQDELPLCEVNLSANGLGFAHPSSLALGERIDIDLVIFPDALLITNRAKVISCQAHAGAFFIGVEFIELSNSHRDAIVRHCLSIEGQQRRKERNE